MKKIHALFAAAILAVNSHAADQAPLFNATLTVGKEHRFVLVDSAGKTSAFLRLGESFAGYALKAYDPKSGLLDLERDGKVTQVSLVADAATAAAPLSATPATLADAEAVLNVMRFEEMIGKTMEEQKKMMGPAMQQMVARMGVPAEERDRVMAMQKKVMDETLDAMSGPEMRKDMARIFSEVYTKEELNGLSAFYATPTGQSMISKQPQVQQKMMQVMMPRMAQMGPKLQEMVKQIKAEKAAARSADAPTAPAAPAPTAPAPAPKQ